MVAENEAKELRRKEAWIDQQMADQNFQLVHPDNDQIVGASVTVEKGTTTGNSGSPTKSPTKRSLPSQASATGPSTIPGPSKMPINQAVTPTSNLSSTAIAMGAATNGDID